MLPSGFYNNPFIQSIEQIPKWSMSTEKKMPIDIELLIKENKIIGASFRKKEAMTTLTFLKQRFSKPQNYAFYIDSLKDNFIVLDIESKCPLDLKQKLLQTPYVYGELSASKNGYHLVYPTPPCFKEYKIAQIKPALKEQHGYYEFLINHWCTFTGNVIPLQQNQQTSDITPLFEHLCKIQKLKKKKRMTFENKKPTTLYLDEIIETLSANEYNKTPECFNLDHSRYEFGYIGFFARKLNNLLSKIDEPLSESDKAWILFHVISQKIQHRDKHDDTRDGLPWLLYLTQRVINSN